MIDDPDTQSMIEGLRLWLRRHVGVHNDPANMTAAMSFALGEFLTEQSADMPALVESTAAARVGMNLGIFAATLKKPDEFYRIGDNSEAAYDVLAARA